MSDETPPLRSERASKPVLLCQECNTIFNVCEHLDARIEGLESTERASEFFENLLKEADSKLSQVSYAAEMAELKRLDSDKRGTGASLKAERLEKELAEAKAACGMQVDLLVAALRQARKAFCAFLGVDGPADMFFSGHAASFNMGRRQMDECRQAIRDMDNVIKANES